MMRVRVGFVFVLLLAAFVTSCSDQRPTALRGSGLEANFTTQSGSGDYTVTLWNGGPAPTGFDRNGNGNSQVLVCQSQYTAVDILTGFADNTTYGGTVTLSGINGGTFNFRSTVTVRYLAVKGGGGTNVYTFDPLSLGANGMTAPGNSISRISFCLDPQPTGRVRVNKTTIGADATFGFALALDGSTDARVTKDVVTSGHAGTTDFVVYPGTYTLTETMPEGWTAGTWACTNTVTQAATANHFTVGAGQTIECAITNTAPGSIEIVKTSTGGYGPFAFSPSGFNGDQGFTLTTTSDGGTARRSFPNLPTGSGYSISEGTNNVWVAGVWSCTRGDAPAGNASAIEVVAGQVTTCSIENQKKGSIVIVKETEGGNGGPFTFRPVHFGTGDFELSTPGTAARQEFANLAPGSGYSISELDAGGWVKGDFTCDNGSPITAIQVNPGATTTCTATNSKLGTVIIVKNTVGGDGTFPFTASGLGSTSFTLTTVRGTVRETFTNVSLGSAHSVSETTPRGWDLTSATCDNDSSPSAISVEAGETVTCTFTNTARGTIRIEKTTEGGDGTFTFSPTGFNDEDDFTVETRSGSGSTEFDNLVPGSSYGLVEAALTGWDAGTLSCGNGSTDAQHIRVTAGDTTTCTITNTKQGSIQITKTAEGGNETFTFTPTNFNGGADFTLTTVDGTKSRTFSNLSSSRTYGIVEDALPDGWDAGQWECDNRSTNTHIVVTPGETTHCSITNTKRGSIRIVKNTIGGDGEFSFTPTGFGDSAFTINTAARNYAQFDNLRPGTNFAIVEDPATGWAVSEAFECDNDSQDAQHINVVAGGVTTCAITNTKLGSIKIVKRSVGGDGTFSFTPGGFGSDSFSLTTASGSADRTFSGLAAGSSYSIAEGTIPAGWDAGTFTCSNGDADAITVVAGQTTTCEITNTKRGSIRIEKTAVGGDGTFSFTPSGFGDGSFDITTTSGTGAAQFNNLLPGTGYGLVEAALTGWDAGTLSCGNGSTDAQHIRVTAGNTTTCTVTNTKRGRIIIQKTTVGYASGTFTFSVDGQTVTVPVSSFTGSGSATVRAGTYTVTETNYGAAWVPTSTTCTVTVPAGGEATCSFTNTYQTTRSQGYWSTHPEVANLYVNSSNYQPSLGCGTKNLSQITVVWGGFAASIPKTTDNRNRGSLDQARMRLLQQWLAANLNIAAFGASPERRAQFTAAAQAYCGTNASAIGSAATTLESFNTSGELGSFSPSNVTALARSITPDRGTWNVLP